MVLDNYLVHCIFNACSVSRALPIAAANFDARGCNERVINVRRIEGTSKYK